MDYDGALENERQILLQEQRACRARVHKFSSETSRRRKALEDRRRQWDVQEQRIRENILQLRKQRMQEATERFQRAHIRPSQRRRPAFVRKAINMDEALSLINARGTYAKPSALRSNTSMGRSFTPPPRPHTYSNSAGHQREPLAIEANTKQEERQRNHITSQQFFLNDLHEAQATHPWEEHADLPSPTESLCSQDSLEIEELKHRQPSKYRGCFQSSPITSEKDSPQLPESYSNGLCPSSVTVPYQAKIRNPEFDLPPSTKVDYYEGHPLLRDEFAEEFENLHRLTSAIAHHNLKDPSQDTQEQDVFGRHSLCAQMRMENNSASAAHHNCNRAITTAELHKEAVVSNHHGKTSACPGSQCPELTCWEQECRTLSEQLKTEEDPSENRFATQVEETSSNICKQRDAFHKNAISVTDAISHRVSGPDSQTNEVVNSHQSNKPQSQADTVHREETNARPSRTVTVYPLSVATDVRIMKSILKKRSKYAAEETKYLYNSGHLIITKHMALSLRDSLELMRGKTKEPENGKTAKKKLRWFDEVNAENHDTTVNYTIESTATKSRLQVGYQQGLNQSTGIHTEAVNTIPTVSSGPQCTFARQAWTDVAVQDSKPQEHSPQEGLKTERAYVCLGVPKVPRRARSARGGTGHASSRVRKDTTLRPQSATEASLMIKQQRKMMVPCPPPRPEVSDRRTPASSSKAAYADDHKHSRSVLPVDKTLYRPNPDGHAGPPPDEGVTFAPCPPPYGCSSSETLAKGRVSFSQHGHHANARRCGAACGENGICLNRTPTDDEISQLWSGVRSALSTKDDCASLAQLNDDCMSGDVRSLAGMGCCHPSPFNGRRPVRRAVPEGNGSKKQMLVQHTLQIPGSGNKKLCLPNQGNLMTIPLPSKVQDQGPSQRMGPPQYAPILSLSGLSLEEQRVQQSLDRLNQRLQYVVGVNPSVKRLFHTEATHQNVSVKHGERTSSGQRRLSTASNAH
ncbi:centrosomal protein of 126 kDa [Sardina pilchardus]|uniref:centrosomal protein of 126 kDa n=1 Tax=Sardina pilchardus TaxID=27697 RepID=UPI002E0ED75E